MHPPKCLAWERGERTGISVPLVHHPNPSSLTHNSARDLLLFVLFSSRLLNSSGSSAEPTHERQRHCMMQSGTVQWPWLGPPALGSPSSFLAPQDLRKQILGEKGDNKDVLSQHCLQEAPGGMGISWRSHPCSSSQNEGRTNLLCRQADGHLWIHLWFHMDLIDSFPREGLVH